MADQVFAPPTWACFIVAIFVVAGLLIAATVTFLLIRRAGAGQEVAKLREENARLRAENERLREQIDNGSTDSTAIRAGEP